MSKSQPIHTESSHRNPVWLVRGMPAAAMLLIAGALFSHSQMLRGLFAGGALGVLIGFCVFATQIKAVVLNDTPQPSDVNRYPIT